MELVKDSGADRNVLLASIRGLTVIGLGRLEKGIGDGLLDPKDVRLLGSLVLRAMRLWQEVLRDERRDERVLEEKVVELENRLSDALEKKEASS